jgi:hypothetical protein
MRDQRGSMPARSGLCGTFIAIVCFSERIGALLQIRFVLVKDFGRWWSSPTVDGKTMTPYAISARASPRNFPGRGPI